MDSKQETLSVSFRVKLFGLLREVVGTKEMTLSLNIDRATVADLKRSLQESFPDLTKAKIPFLVAVNRKIAQESTTIMPSDEIAILPLVSGG